MSSNTYERGSFTITDKFIHLYGTTINLSNIDNMQFVDFDRHSYFAGIKDWFIGLVIAIVICAIWNNLAWLGDLYIFSIFILIAYNIYKHRLVFYGLKIETSAGCNICLKSDSREFLNNVHEAIEKAMHSKTSNYSISFDSHDVINNGIISTGNKNKNTVKVSKEND